LIGSAFYSAYFIGSLILLIISNVIGYDILNKIGYKKGIIYGLWISVAGALLIIPSANAIHFRLFSRHFYCCIGLFAPANGAYCHSIG
jgi:FHS family L-fucose permease-like MFS transporter